uniref:Uncharacterized protein n=1 Tax=Arion vulgaris TaxID=1028688 RepID=A0A0B7B8I5_9EUPU
MISLPSIEESSKLPRSKEIRDLQIENCSNILECYMGIPTLFSGGKGGSFPFDL